VGSGSFFGVIQKPNYFEIRLNNIQWRLDIWRASLKMIQDRPVIGHGINTFMRTLRQYDNGAYLNPTYAHNCYIQVTAETGILGLSCFLYILLQMFRSAKDHIAEKLKNIDLRFIAIGLLTGALAFLTHSFFDVNFYSLQLSVHFWFMVGMLFAVMNLKKV